MNNLQALFEGNAQFRRDATEACMVNVACPCFETAAQAEEWLRAPVPDVCQPYGSAALPELGAGGAERRDERAELYASGRFAGQGTGNSL